MSKHSLLVSRPPSMVGTATAIFLWGATVLMALSVTVGIAIVN